jgi:hypothetical protein
VSNFSVLDQEIISGHINGCNYAPKVRVLARTHDNLLLWVPGSSYWSGMYGTRYSGAEMRVVHRRTHGVRELTSGLICEGQRLKQSIFADNADKIDAVFGECFHKMLETRKTVVVGHCEPFSKIGHELPVTGREFGYEHVMKQMAERERLMTEGVTGLELSIRSLQAA